MRTSKPFSLLVAIYLPLVAVLAAWLWLKTNCVESEENTLVHYWEPEFALGVMRPEQDRAVMKLGGLPWGFPIERWPTCGECGVALSHIAQLPHVPGTFDLGAPGRVLYVFHCELDGVCSTWDDSTGASNMVLLEQGEVGEGMTAPPAKTTEIIGEYHVAGWARHRTPRILLENYDTLVDQDLFFATDDVVTDLMFALDTKVGGIPHWTGNGPYGYPDPPFEFLAQFGTFVHCEGQPPTPNEARTTVRYNSADGSGKHRYEDPAEGFKGGARHLIQIEPHGDGFYGDWANLGSDGTAYLYIDRTATTPRFVWFWNR